MKGQAFVTLPGTEQAKQAVADVNAFVLKGKPMAVVSSRRIHVISFVFSSSVHHSVYLLLHLSFLIFFRWVFFSPLPWVFFEYVYGGEEIRMKGVYV